MRSNVAGLVAKAVLSAPAGQKQYLERMAALLKSAGKVDVFAEVSNGKVLGLTAAGMQVKKVKSKQKLAEAHPAVTLVSAQLAQVDVYYYGYWVYDADFDYYYWFPTEVVIVDNSWVEYVY